MEMIDYYLDQVEKVHGVYILRVDEECTDEMVHYYHESWVAMMGDSKHLLIIPKSFQFTFVERYSLYEALMLVRSGKKITRDAWVQEIYPTTETYLTYITPQARKKAAYLKLNDNGEIVKVNHRKEKKSKPFLISIEDMDANDYVIVE